MSQDLMLKGLELSVFSTIYGFSRDGQGNYHGSRRYLAELCNCSIKGVDKAIKRLLEKQLIEKESWVDDKKQKKCIYTINFKKVNEIRGCDTQGTELPGVGNSVTWSRERSNHNNIIDNKEENTLSKLKENWKRYGLFENVKLDDYWDEYIHIASPMADEYIERLDTYIEKNELNTITEKWPVRRFGITIYDWMRRDGATSMDIEDDYVR